MSNRGIVSIILISLMIVGMSACSVKKNDGNTIESNILTDTIKFKDDDFMSGQIIKYKLTKTAEVNLKMYINDSTEYTDFFDTKVAVAPATINIMCKMLPAMFFNFDELENFQDGGNMTIESNNTDPGFDLKNYTVTRVYFEFIDYEDRTKIADCTSTGPEDKDVSFNAYRTYENSFLGTQIGVFSEDSIL